MNILEGKYFEYKKKEFFNKFEKAKPMVLSTCVDNAVSSRMVNIILYNEKFYFQTHRTTKKYKEIIKNNNVSICIDNFQVQGICKEIGKPFDTENEFFIILYKSYFEKFFNEFSYLENQVVFEITPKKIETCLYVDNVHHIEYYDFDKKRYIVKEYELK